ncbi:hypothetical protein DMUE_4054 [Dictyocoela muelleri]|nr:hypothetical protein DMUE_4054 [Dictyocoela muelleri]
MCGFESREINLNNKKFFKKFINSDIKSIYVRHLCGYNYHASDHNINPFLSKMSERNDYKTNILATFCNHDFLHELQEIKNAAFLTNSILNLEKNDLSTSQ